MNTLAISKNKSRTKNINHGDLVIKITWPFLLSIIGILLTVTWFGGFKLSKIESSLASLNSRLEAVEIKVDNIDKRLTNLEIKVSSFESKIDNFDFRVSRLETKVR